MGCDSQCMELVGLLQEDFALLQNSIIVEFFLRPTLQTGLTTIESHIATTGGVRGIGNGDEPKLTATSVVDWRLHMR